MCGFSCAMPTIPALRAGIAPAPRQQPVRMPDRPGLAGNTILDDISADAVAVLIQQPGLGPAVCPRAQRAGPRPRSERSEQAGGA